MSLIKLHSWHIIHVHAHIFSLAHLYAYTYTLYQTAYSGAQTSGTEKIHTSQNTHTFIMPVVLLDVKNDVATLTLNRPRKGTRAFSNYMMTSVFVMFVFLGFSYSIVLSTYPRGSERQA